MTILKNTAAIALTLLVLQLVPGSPLKAAETSNATSAHHDDEVAIREQAKEYAKAFGTGDVTTLANMWAVDGTFTDSSGRNYNGRPAIQGLLTSFFKAPSGRPMEINIQSIKFPADNVAIEEGTAKLLRSRAIGTMTRYTVVHVKENGKWQMAAVSETDYLPSTEADTLKDLSWLIGNWSVKGDTNSGVKLKADWKAQDKFIHCFFGSEMAGGGSSGEMQIIGFNPVSRRLISWHFDSMGGYGYGQWFKDGNFWIESAHGVQPDGTPNGATYVLHKIDENTFGWKSTGRTLGGQPLPDTQELTITRDQAANN